MLESWLTPQTQEWIALSIVALVAGTVAWRLLGGAFANAVALYLLRRGKVKWAMRLRRFRSCCG